MSIVPDTKDWTWVLERTCPQCGFDTRTVTRQGLPGMLTENAGVWDELLNEKGETSRLRPSPDRWSTLEYACHVRDVFRKFDERLQVMVSMEDPTFLNWDQDATAVDDRYHEQSPVEVASQLTAAAGTLGDTVLSIDRRSVGTSRFSERWGPVHRRVPGPLFDARPCPPPLRRRRAKPRLIGHKSGSSARAAAPSRTPGAVLPAPQTIRVVLRPTLDPKAPPKARLPALVTPRPPAPRSSLPLRRNCRRQLLTGR